MSNRDIAGDLRQPASVDRNDGAALLDPKHPNFLAAVFSFLAKDEEYLANPQQSEAIRDLFNKFYGIHDESLLDKNNNPLAYITRANENRKKAGKQSLTTVSACSSVIMQVLIG